jgi:hypothetical protein
MPPSKIVEELITEKRLTWVPLGTAAAAAAAAAGTTVGTSPAAVGAGCGEAAAAAAAAGHTGCYVWQQGPVDAWLSSSRASKQARAEELQQKQHPRNQAKLLLNLDPYLRNSSSMGGPCKGLFVSPAKQCLQQQQQQQQQRQLGVGASLEFKYHEMSHKSSCQLQRHPVLAAHDRLVRVTVDRHRLCATAATAAGSSGSNGSSVLGAVNRGQQVRDAVQRGLEDVLTHGVVLAGRRYSR